MGPDVLGIFVPISAIVGGCALLGLKIWSSHKLKMRETPDADNELLTEVQQLSDEVGSMREALAEFHERVDFTERMLSEIRSRNAIGPGDST